MCMILRQKGGTFEIIHVKNKDYLPSLKFMKNISIEIASTMQIGVLQANKRRRLLGTLISEETFYESSKRKKRS